MLLPGHYPLSHFIIKYEHERHLHVEPQTIIAAIHQNYWFTSARGIVCQIIKKCITCFRNSSIISSAIMRNLSEARVNILQFETCGVDYGGPFFYKDEIRRNAKLIKCYRAIFICFTTKAVHIELTANLSSEAFLNVFKRFIARKNCPFNIYLDNGLNFVGAERELDELNTLLKNQKTQELITEYTANNNIQWHFISSRGLHHGGLWEAIRQASSLSYN